ncbi:MAG: cation transporter, partial [Phototrophicales bacterium]
LLADSLDMFGDAFMYGVTIWALDQRPRMQLKVSLLKGLLMWLVAGVVVFRCWSQWVHGWVPRAEWMGGVGVLALVVNFISAYFLMRHKDDNLNMKSVWLCSRNDMFANVGIIIGAVFVYQTRSHYPDLIVGLALSLLFIH